MLIPRTRTQLVDVAAPVVWTLELAFSTAWRLRSESVSCGQFRDGLKTYLFLKAAYKLTHDSLRTSVLRVYLLVYLLNYVHLIHKHLLIR